jgi:uncharacterized membrane protein
VSVRVPVKTQDTPTHAYIHTVAHQCTVFVTMTFANDLLVCAFGLFCGFCGALVVLAASNTKKQQVKGMWR